MAAVTTPDGRLSQFAVFEIAEGGITLAFAEQTGQDALEIIQRVVIESGDFLPPCLALPFLSVMAPVCCHHMGIVAQSQPQVVARRLPHLRCIRRCSRGIAQLLRCRGVLFLLLSHSCGRQR